MGSVVVQHIIENVVGEWCLQISKRLALLHGVKLGSALSIQEIPVPKGQVVNYTPYPQADDDDERRVTSTNLAEIPVKVRLLVRFAIEGADPTTASTVILTAITDILSMGSLLIGASIALK